MGNETRNEHGKSLKINCGLACLLNDREGVLDAYDSFAINCGDFIASPAIHAKLSAKGAQINCGSMQIKEVKGTIVQLDGGAVIDGKAEYKDMFILVNGDLVLKGDGVRALSAAEGAIVTGTLYYPESGDPAALAKVGGGKRAYPDGASVLLGDYDLEKAVASAGGSKYLWVSGRLTALNKKALEDAQAAGLKITCAALFTYEGLNAASGDLITCPDRDLVPDGYEITGDLDSAKLPLYGSKIYVNGDFRMEAKDLPALERLERIVVKGTAHLPAAAAQTFRKKGTAGDYEIVDGRVIEVHGFQQFAHGQLAAAAAAGEQITYVVHGCLLFNDDVTAEDVACIAGLTYHGTVLAPAAVQAALAPRVRGAHGFMGDPALVERLMGLSIQSLIQGWMGLGAGSDGPSHFPGSGAINTTAYILI
jgi:hypothetical protein